MPTFTSRKIFSIPVWGGGYRAWYQGRDKTRVSPATFLHIGSCLAIRQNYVGTRDVKVECSEAHTHVWGH